MRSEEAEQSPAVGGIAQFRPGVQVPHGEPRHSDGSGRSANSAAAARRFSRASSGRTRPSRPIRARRPGAGRHQTCLAWSEKRWRSIASYSALMLLPPKVRAPRRSISS